MEKKELNVMDAKSLEKKVDSLKKDLFNLKLNSKSSHVKDHSQYRKLRVQIARALTYLNQKKKEI